MSQESKEVAEKVKRSFEAVERGADKLVEETAKFDRDLSQKIQRVKESAKEVTKHIEERSR